MPPNRTRQARYARSIEAARRKLAATRREDYQSDRYYQAVRTRRERTVWQLERLAEGGFPDYEELGQEVPVREPRLSAQINVRADAETARRLARLVEQTHLKRWEVVRDALREFEERARGKEQQDGQL